ncbi:MAG TPA: glycosyltransferase family 2 protein [Thermoanaerobaculia bacterium]|nr:glycosyltransferase family 2 protein [Thermoanaerobaculia bacterium]
MGGLVSVVVVSWNSAPYLPRCLDGIRRQTWRDLELIAVDNASSDDSAKLLEEGGRLVRPGTDGTSALLRNDTNRGFSAAVNQALAVARGEFLLIVNPDCFLEPEYVERLVAAFDADDIGSATGLLLRARGFEIEPMEEVDSAGMRMTRNGRHLDITDRPDARTEVFGVSGAAGMFRVAFLRDAAIGGEVFDEDFFAYREDADLAWRGRLFGWRAVCEPGAVAYHVRRVTPEARNALPADINMHSVKNRFLLRWKNEGWYLALRNAPFELARDLVVLLAALAIEHLSLPAFGWLWRNRARVSAKRREIQRRRKVSDRELARWFR